MFSHLIHLAYHYWYLIFVSGASGWFAFDWDDIIDNFRSWWIWSAIGEILYGATSDEDDDDPLAQLDDDDGEDSEW